MNLLCSHRGCTDLAVAAPDSLGHAFCHAHRDDYQSAQAVRNQQQREKAVAELANIAKTVK